ncbi:MAG: rod shape-determining protein MreC [Desulfuromonas sp.]|uniref:rod shape-determining protein MreC n=1 Tax=Desulfuromonas sp. TaxID=892 RepID=UPI000CBE2FF4|nr:rod shape-determining protein MreC [Desulfuromonas sp.]PLX81830.1 MAG: rod shape-determining protein MreC [Desulfuromonas sp.]
MFELLRKYRRSLVATALLLAALLLYSGHLKKREHTTLFERAVLRLAAPLQGALSAPWELLADKWERYLYLVRTEDDNARMHEENRTLKAELAGLQEVRLANERLRLLLDFRDRVALPALPAQVVAEDASNWFRTVVIDKGLEDGVREGMPVVVAEGVVGRIIRCGAHQARVLLITDASSAVASLVQRNRTRGVCRGRGQTLTLEFALRLEDIKAGDRIVTSGMGGVFPKGLVIGEVVKVYRGDYGLFQSVEMAPATDFARLEEVLVLLGEEP